MAESLAEAFADEVTLPRSLFEQPHSLLSETSTLLNAIPDIESIADVKTSPTVASETEEFAGESTIVPHKFHQKQPSMGDWMGNWWTKGKSRERTSPEGDKDPPITPNGLVGSRQPNAKRRTAQSVFGTLGIPIFNSTGSASSAVKTKAIVVKDNNPSTSSDTVSVKSGKSAHGQGGMLSGAVSMLSSPLQPSFAPSPVAPLITTVIDNVASNTLSKASSVVDEPLSLLVQGATLRAIANATRVMTSDSSSILADKGKETSPLIAQLAMDLIKHARDEGVAFHDRQKERKDIKGTDYSRSSLETPERAGMVATLSSAVGPSDIAALLNRTLSAAHVEGTKKATKSSKLKPRTAGIMQQVTSPFTSPLLGSLIGPQPKKVSTISASGASSTAHDTISPSRITVPSATLSPSSVATVGRALSVPLESIIPATAQPPTHYLSRIYTPLTSKDFRFTIPLPQSASKFTIYHDDKNQRPLTDRYGFMYDVSQYDVLLLIRAKECGNTAPACLTGVKIADREEDNSWPEEDEVKSTIEIIKGSCPCDGSGNGVDLDTKSLASNYNFDSTNSPVEGDTTSISIKSRSSSKSRRRSSVITSATGIASTINVNMTNSTTSILSVNSETPRHGCANVVRRLLDELTVIHDERQAARRKEWDAFVRQRIKVRLSSKATSSGSSVAAGAGVGGAAAAILGLGTDGEQDEMSHTEGLIGFAQLGLSSNRDERREFEKLVRNGIPLVYRSKVWFECSGALEMKEPGHFQDLLAQKDGLDGVLHEIEKDVGRTMPLNIFFGGDGVGVDKLRRVLTAYSR